MTAGRPRVADGVTKRPSLQSIRVLAAALILLGLAAAPGNAEQPAPMAASTAAAPPLFDNLGTWTHPVTTSSPQAQKYFDQGLRLVYAFNHQEAIRAFKEAQRLDPNCAMAYWGEALALGPNINLDVDPEREKQAYEAVSKARSLEDHASAEERALIDALTKRYSTASNADLKKLAHDYTDAMRQVVHSYPNEPDASTLFAESILDLNPWSNWTHDGQPKPGTLEAVATLEAVIKAHPDCPGANHYYIHAVEASPHPERALPAADRLARLEPGAGHLVHMPSHIYIRVGRYNDAVLANEKAVVVDKAYIAQFNPPGPYPMIYYPHNVQFIYAAACMEGRSAEAIQAARDVAALAPAEMIRHMPIMEFIEPTPLLALARFGKWSEILKEPAPPADLHYTTGIWHYARGIAFVRTGQLDKAEQESSNLKATEKAMAPKTMLMQNTANDLLALASHVLDGEIALKQGKNDQAIDDLTEAVRLEDALTYSEPPDWYYPVRQSLGAALLTAGKPKDAEAVYREDLKENPNNGWSLDGLAQSLRAQKRDAEAAAVDKQFQDAWSHSDVIIVSSEF